jgi:hypothetical protein
MRASDACLCHTPSNPQVVGHASVRRAGPAVGTTGEKRQRQCLRRAFGRGPSDVLDANDWIEESAMRSFMLGEPHRRAMSRLKEWCDEAAVVHWTQDSPEPPSWADAHRRVQREGRPSMVRHPTAAHRAFQIAAPRIGRFGELRFEGP